MKLFYGMGMVFFGQILGECPVLRKRGIEKYPSVKNEFEEVTKLFKKSKDPALKDQLDFLENETHRMERSLEMKNSLDSYGVPDNAEWDKKLLDTIADAANQKLPKQYGNIGLKETVDIIFEAPNGKIKLTTRWEKIDYAKFWMNTIIIKR